MKPNERDNEARIAALEQQVAALRHARTGYGVRRRAATGIGGLPWYDVALGPDFERGEWRGHARGVVAIGDFATGIIAIGGLSRGVIAAGGLAAGLFSLGGLSIGLVSAIGGLAIGALAIGGGAGGGVAVGGAAAGYYACGGAAFGSHVVSALQIDPEAQRFFEERTGGAICSPARLRLRVK